MKILVVEDEKPFRELLCSFLQGMEHRTEEAATVVEGLQKAGDFQPDVVLLDVNLPDGTGLDFQSRLAGARSDASLVLMTANVDLKTAVAAIKLGAEDYLGKPLDLEEVEIILEKLSEKRGLKRDLAALKGHQKDLYGKDYLFLSDPRMQRVYGEIDQVSQQSSVTVLIQGETGTGKEHVAKLIHVLSSRTAAPFLEFHCGAMPENLLESELFGYEPGAFTDARRAKPGLFEVANGGTVFLDEVGELPPTLQTKLLKVLEQKTFRRLGGLQEIKVNVRVVAATNRDLQKEVKEGRFRSDLYYRLNVAFIGLPPLRSRPEDIRGLAQFFFRDLCGVFQKKLGPLTPEFLELLTAYDWPGNVRELKNVMERAVLYAKGPALTLADLPAEVGILPSYHPLSPDARALSADDAEKENIRKALRNFEDNKTRVAKYLGVSRTTLIAKVKKYGLE